MQQDGLLVWDEDGSIWAVDEDGNFQRRDPGVDVSSLETLIPSSARVAALFLRAELAKGNAAALTGEAAALAAQAQQLTKKVELDRAARQQGRYLQNGVIYDENGGEPRELGRIDTSSSHRFVVTLRKAVSLLMLAIPTSLAAGALIVSPHHVRRLTVNVHPRTRLQLAARPPGVVVRGRV